MSQENVDQFMRGLEASNRRDIEALLDTLDPEVEWSPAFPVLLGGESKVYRGHDGVREMFRAFYATDLVGGRTRRIDGRQHELGGRLRV
jgi:SnoaL-like domain